MLVDYFWIAGWRLLYALFRLVNNVRNHRYNAERESRAFCSSLARASLSRDLHSQMKVPSTVGEKGTRGRAELISTTRDLPDATDYYVSWVFFPAECERRIPSLFRCCFSVRGLYLYSMCKYFLNPRARAEYNNIFVSHAVVPSCIRFNGNWSNKCELLLYDPTCMCVRFVDK